MNNLIVVIGFALCGTAIARESTDMRTTEAYKVLNTVKRTLTPFSDLEPLRTMAAPRWVRIALHQYAYGLSDGYDLRVKHEQAGIRASDAAEVMSHATP